MLRRHPLADGSIEWPDLTDPQACRAWLRQTWNWLDVADAIRHATPVLADRVDELVRGRAATTKQIRRAAMAVARYLLRSSGRPTPFGLFAGTAPATVGGPASVRWDAHGHHAFARVNTEWLADVIRRLEDCQELLDRLNVVFNNLATHQGDRLYVPLGPTRVSIRWTQAVEAVRELSTTPVRFAELTDVLTDRFLGADRPTVNGMLAELVHRGVLISSLRAPLTVTDPLTHLLEQLHEANAHTVVDVAGLLRDLEAISAGIRRRNIDPRGGAALGRRMAAVSSAGRTPLAVDVRLDCEVRVPRQVIREMERAADALVRLTRQPTGQAAWRDFHIAFCDRYGIGTLVPLDDVVNPDIGLGYPAGYPGSIFPVPASALTARHERLWALAWQAVADGFGEITLTNERIAELTADDHFDEANIPPHVELAARVHAASLQDLEAGAFTLVVAPARAAGTLTSRFTPIATGSGLEEVYRGLPTSTSGALPVQLSFPPAYPHAENICRVPAYLPHLLPLAEHRSGEAGVIGLEDLAVTATRDRLHMVSLSRHQVVEPQVFHALALDKQPPPLARFLAHLPRAFTADWHDLDWGPHTHRLPYLPRVRYGRVILSSAQWRLTATDLPSGAAGREAFDRWRRIWRCPPTVELRDADRTLRLCLDEPAHLFLLRAHLARHGHATLTEAPTPAELGWMKGHVHEIAVPLVTTRAPRPSPLSGSLPRLTGRSHGHLPGSPDAGWLYTKIYTHAERHDELIATHLPDLMAALGEDPVYWFVRYRSAHETDHLRLRIRTRNNEQDTHATAVGAWARRLRHRGVAGRVTFDTYFPETGRYGSGAAMEAAEAVFAADSRAVAGQLRGLPATTDLDVVTALNLIDIASGFLGNPRQAVDWLADHPVPGATPPRTAVDQVLDLVRAGAPHAIPGWSDAVTRAWQDRVTTLVSYQQARLADGLDVDAVLDSLLHLHCNRAIGIDPDRERTCRRLARRAALAHRAPQGEPR